MNRLKLRVWDPVLNKGAIWTYWEGAYRDTGRDEGATMVHPDRQQERLVLVHPAAQQHRQRRRRRAVRLPVQGPRRTTRRRTKKKSSAVPVVKERVSIGDDASPAISRRRTTRTGPSRSRATAGCWSAMRSAFSIRCTRPASCWRYVRRAGRRRDREGLEKGDTSAAQLGKWGPVFNEGVDRMRRLVCEYYDGFSFGNFVRNYPHLQGTVTDLLIGDLFTERVDKVWSPMESLYPAWEGADPAVGRRHARRASQQKANELMLPEGRRP